MTAATVVVVPLDKLEALIRAAIRSEVTAVEKKSEAPTRALLTARQVIAEYRIGKDQLREFGDSQRLPFVKRTTRGGKQGRFYRREDCDRVLADTLHRF